MLKAAHRFAGRGGRLSEPGIVVVQEKRIVGAGADAVIPAGSRVIEHGDATLVPGFIDAHTHISYDHDRATRMPVLVMKQGAVGWGGE